MEWAVRFVFGNMELSLGLWNIISGISGFDDLGKSMLSRSLSGFSMRFRRFSVNRMSDGLVTPNQLSRPVAEPILFQPTE